MRLLLAQLAGCGALTHQSAGGPTGNSCRCRAHRMRQLMARHTQQHHIVAARQGGRQTPNGAVCTNMRSGLTCNAMHFAPVRPQSNSAPLNLRWDLRRVGMARR